MVRFGCFFASTLLISTVVACSGPGSSSYSPNIVSEIDERFQDIDRHALSAPRQAETSVSSLVEYFRQGTQNETEMTRAIFRWIAENVTYDTDAYRAGGASDESPESVLSTGRAVCGGFANLFQALADEAGIESVVITGFSKGYSFRTSGNLGPRARHAWNAVRIDGHWRLIDATWASGHFDESAQFVRSFHGHYFMTDPQEFVYDHFPDEPRWQLSESPLTREQYLALPLVSRTFFDLDLDIVSHNQLEIRADSELDLTFRGDDSVAATANLIRGNQQLDGSHVFVQHDGELFHARVVFPEPGEYILRIFARRRISDDRAYSSAIEYWIAAQGPPQGNERRFPDILASFHDAGAFLERPFDHDLASGRNHRFEIRVPNAERVSVVTGGQWHDLDKRGDRFSGSVRIEAGSVQVAAQFPNESRFQVLLGYEGR